MLLASLPYHNKDKKCDSIEGQCLEKSVIVGDFGMYIPFVREKKSRSTML
jgi:hypothetical protein